MGSCLKLRSDNHPSHSVGTFDPAAAMKLKTEGSVVLTAVMQDVRLNWLIAGRFDGCDARRTRELAEGRPFPRL